MLGAASPPEDDRGGACPESRPRRCARRPARRGRARRARRRLRRRRHRRVPRRRRRALLLPRDEHPPAGRASRSPSWSAASTWCSCRSAIAAGEPLPFRQDGPGRGHAIEAPRLRRGSGAWVRPVARPDRGVRRAGRPRRPLRRGRVVGRRGPARVRCPDRQGHRTRPRPDRRHRAACAAPCASSSFSASPPTPSSSRRFSATRRWPPVAPTPS